MNTHIGNGTKNFKVWEKQFSARQVANEQELWLAEFERLAADGVEGFEIGVDKWTHGYDQPPQELARWAVYTAIGVEGWQLFRCAMKGTTTTEKLMMLYARWHDAHCTGADERAKATGDMDRDYVEYLRINNYIGALRRGGQLDESLKIAKGR